MGSFKQHVTCSTVTGIVIGGLAYQYGFSLPTCLLAGGLCSMAGMLPDIDSDTSRSFQECIYLAAGLCAFLVVQRLRAFDTDPDVIMLGGAGMFLFVRFVVGEFIKKSTAHRGMFHSIPAAIFSGQITFFISAGTATERLLKALALTTGYLSHLILDEICSIDSTGKELRLKKSFGTAMKFYDSKRAPAALILYAAIVFLGMTAVKQPELIEQFEERRQLYASEEPDAPQRDNARVFTSQNPSSPEQEHVHAIRLQAAEYLARLDRGEQAAEATTASDVSPVRISPVNQSRYSEHRIFSRGRRRNEGPAQISVAEAAAPAGLGNPGYSAPQLNTTSPSRVASQDPMATFVPPGLESRGATASSAFPAPQPSGASGHPGFYSSAETAAPTNVSTADVPIFGMPANDFRPRNNGYSSLPKPGPAPISFQ